MCLAMFIAIDIYIYIYERTRHQANSAALPHRPDLEFRVVSCSRHHTPPNEFSVQSPTCTRHITHACSTKDSMMQICVEVSMLEAEK